MGKNSELPDITSFILNVKEAEKVLATDWRLYQHGPHLQEWAGKWIIFTDGESVYPRVVSYLQCIELGLDLERVV